MTRLPAPPGFSVLLRQEFRTVLGGVTPPWRVVVAPALVAAGFFLGADPSRGFFLPAGPSPIAVDVAILFALVLAMVTWYPRGEHSPDAWRGVRHQPVAPTHRRLARALTGSVWVLLAGVALLTTTAVGPQITGHGSVGLPSGAIAALLTSMVVAYLFWSVSVVYGPWVSLPSLALASGVVWALVQTGGSATEGGLAEWLLEGTLSPGAALVGASLPAALLWGSLFLLLIPFGARHEGDGKEAGAGLPGQAGFGPPFSGGAGTARWMSVPPAIRVHLGSLLGIGAARVIGAYVFLAALGGLISLTSAGAEMWRPHTWGVALDHLFLFARGASVVPLGFVFMAVERSFLPSTFPGLGALPVSRRRYLLSRGAVLLGVALVGALALHLIVAGWTLLAGEPMATAGYLAGTLWMLLAVTLTGVTILSATKRPLILMIGLAFVAPLLVLGLIFLFSWLHVATGGFLPEPEAYGGFYSSLQAGARGDGMGILLLLLLPLAGAAWFATGRRPVHWAN